MVALPAGAPANPRPPPTQARGGQRGATQRGGRGRGRAPRARAGRGPGPASRGGARGAAPPRGSLAGKRKFDGGAHQNQGDSKRRFHNSQDDGQQWYQDSFNQTWG